MSVLLSQLWEVNMELWGEPISGDIFTLDLLYGYHKLKPQAREGDWLFKRRCGGEAPRLGPNAFQERVSGVVKCTQATDHLRQGTSRQQKEVDTFFLSPSLTATCDWFHFHCSVCQALRSCNGGFQKMIISNNHPQLLRESLSRYLHLLPRSHRLGLRHEPSYKFLAFNSGPRTCYGKHLAMTKMKTVVANREKF
ncbi:hypothetical protein YC2023_042404 [Brassica napus]